MSRDKQSRKMGKFLIINVFKVFVITDVLHTQGRKWPENSLRLHLRVLPSRLCEKGDESSLHAFSCSTDSTHPVFIPRIWC